ncbi:MAG: GNAT family N-acetyltransferase [Anaerolineales bacterium]|nr:GNAT family N-acetyltransferase [Anaerolineales bacterium]MCB9146003.1 GNAT family N-acetyltransferase [Anaerolineales bacterium]
MSLPNIRLIETPDELHEVEELQRLVWPGSETDIVPMHMMITVAHNGGLVLGAFEEEKLIGFVYGFPGLETTPDGPRPKHCSHQMGIHPEYRDGGIGFSLKRAQWQMVRHQGLDHMTWTYDPLLSRNARLNISKLGAVCTTYRESEYGEMRDGINAGLPSDRFQVDWWINSRRVEKRLSKSPRPPLTLRHVYRSGVKFFYTPQTRTDGLIVPPEHLPPFEERLLLAEIPVDFPGLKAKDFALGRDWRFFTRELFETAFAKNYIVTDFVFDANEGNPRGLYVLTHGDSTLDEFE